MNSKTTYAVVDIETTGTDMSVDNRIIQFSCTLVAHGKIVETYVSDINPQREVPERIIQLTGITPERLKKAPTFDQVSSKLYKLLSGTVFVAHNVNFDFPFLNGEFQRVGYPELDIEAIDTVTLSQILLPTLSSYRLQDLSAYFNIIHNHPHTADSDALATAKLLLILLRQVKMLPRRTLEQIIQINPSLPLDTMKVFIQVNDENRSESLAEKLPDQLKLSAGLVLRKREPVLNEPHNKTAEAKFPKTRTAKSKILPPHLESRIEQNKMMNMIYNNYASDGHHPAKPLVIEAPTGIGKSLGYSLPFSYLANAQKPVVISTATTYLQFQLQNQTLPLLNQSLPFKINSVILKGASHYIDLNKFRHLLFVADSSVQTAFIKAQILVWLTMTTTGDLDELHLNVEQTPFVWTIQHSGVKWLDANSPFYDEDFLRYNLKKAQNADFIIVNHSYLLKNWQFFSDFPVKPYLLIDETQQFAETAIRNNQKQINPLAVMSAVNRVRGDIQEGHHGSARDAFSGNSVLNNSADDLDETLNQIKSLLKQLTHSLYSQMIANQQLHKNASFFVRLIPISDLKAIINENRETITRLQDKQSEVEDLLIRLNSEIDHSTDAFTNRDYSSIYDLYEDFNEFAEKLTFLLSIIDMDESAINQNVVWVTVNHVKDINSFTINQGILKTEDYLNHRIYASFEPPTFTGATIFSSRRSQFIFNLLGIDRKAASVRRLQSDFDPKNQARIYLIDKQSKEHFITNSDDYLQQVAQSIEKIYQASPRQTLVLFNSLKAIEKTHQFLSKDGFTATHLVLAQGVNGTAARLSKQFIHNEPAILLGANTFWEGVDFPAHLLENLIIAQLPFDTPEDPYNHALYSVERSKGKNPFYSLALPKATLRLRQGMGRLLRTKADYGTIFVLDPRLTTKRYGQTILTNLKNEIPVMTGQLDDCINDMVKFFESRN
ncbi:exonuclease domain-containing protein [Lentilactobacillus hilgardii]|nr:helicase C-terminal domain-containing protein [Lentilactobacillus hilgardii]MCV3740291.1 exonuclease domain-containing protein [Lentilactobacillus hilgardii]